MATALTLLDVADMEKMRQNKAFMVSRKPETSILAIELDAKVKEGCF